MALVTKNVLMVSNLPYVVHSMILNENSKLFCREFKTVMSE